MTESYTPGKFNNGKDNTGNNNLGIKNTGSGNIGHYNSGMRNKGNNNTGNMNIASHNAGNCNTKDHNAGNHNQGMGCSGSWNKTNHSSGHFCTVSEYRMFNKPCSPEDFLGPKPSWLYFPLTEWISSLYMTDEEKEANPLYKEMGGYLKVYEFKEAARLAWDKVSLEEKKATLQLANFDADIFFEIFGIDVRKEWVKL